jgi:hypothetical protein
MEALIAWRSGARKRFQVKDARETRTAFGGGLLAVLELKSPSRKISSKHSMIEFRLAARPFTSV